MVIIRNYVSVLTIYLLFVPYMFTTHAIHS